MMCPFSGITSSSRFGGGVPESEVWSVTHTHAHTLYAFVCTQAYVCVCVCVPACMHVCECVRACMYECGQYMHMCVNVCVPACLSVVNTCMHMCVCVSVVKIAMVREVKPSDQIN